MIKKIGNIWAIAYIFILLTAIPLYVEDNYFNLLEAKMHCFCAISIIMVPIGLILFIAGQRREGLKSICRFPLDIPIIAFAVMAFVSSLVSGTLKYSFFGTLGWGIGSFTWLMLAISYILISRCITDYGNIWLAIILVNIVIIIFAVLQAAGVDVFNMHEGVLESQKCYYFSTIGHTNWWVGYLCIFMPITAVFFMRSQKIVSRIIWFVFWVFLCMASIVIEADGLFVGLGLCMFFMVIYVMKKIQRIADCGWMVAAYGACILIVSILPCFKSRLDAVDAGISRQLIHVLPGALIMAVGLLIGILCTFVFKDIAAKTSRVITIIIEVIMAAAVIYMVVKAVIGFDDTWGTWRGQIWRYSSYVWNDFSWKERLFGIGPEMLRNAYSELSEVYGMSVYVTHSEPFQYLLTTGIFGVSCWLGIWVTAIVVYVRNTRRGYDMPAYFLAMMAFFGQSLINSAMTTNLAVLFVIMALFSQDILNESVKKY